MQTDIQQKAVYIIGYKLECVRNVLSLACT